MRMQDYLNELANRRTKIESGGTTNKVKQVDTLSARERILTLLDEYSFVEIGAFVKPRTTDYNMQEVEAPADGVVTGYGLIEGRLVYVYSQDVTVLGGALGEMHGRKITNIYDLALKVGAPIIGLLDSAGVRLQESVDALEAFGQIFVKQSLASGVIPQISAVMGTCGGSASVLPSLSDFTFMTSENSALFLNSANTLDETLDITDIISDSNFHASKAGVIDCVCDNESVLLQKIRTLIELLPANNQEEAPSTIVSDEDDFNRLIPEFNQIVEEGLDGRNAINLLVDHHSFFELKEHYGPDVVIGLCKLGGMSVGIIANQAYNQEARLSLEGCQKIKEFVNCLDAFSIPVITLVDVIGFEATLEGEVAGQSKYTGKMISAFANATIPKISVLTNRGIGLAYVALNSKHIGADIVYAWPSAKVSIMEAEPAVRIIYSEEIEQSEVAKTFINEKTALYTEAHMSPYHAASRGYIDDIIEPIATRKRLIAALEMLFTKSSTNPDRKHRSV